MSTRRIITVYHTASYLSSVDKDCCHPQQSNKTQSEELHDCTHSCNNRVTSGKQEIPAIANGSRASADTVDFWIVAYSVRKCTDSRFDIQFDIQLTPVNWNRSR